MSSCSRFAYNIHVLILKPTLGSSCAELSHSSSPSSAMAQQVFPLLRLPPEVLTHIRGRLPSEDAVCLALTCKTASGVLGWSAPGQTATSHATLRRRSKSDQSCLYYCACCRILAWFRDAVLATNRHPEPPTVYTDGSFHHMLHLLCRQHVVPVQATMMCSPILPWEVQSPLSSQRRTSKEMFGKQRFSRSRCAGGITVRISSDCWLSTPSWSARRCETKHQQNTQQHGPYSSEPH